MGVVLSLDQSAFYGRNDHFVTLTFRQYKQFIGIISSVCKKLFCQQAFYQITCRNNVIYISCGKVNAQRIAEGINYSVDLGG